MFPKKINVRQLCPFHPRTCSPRWEASISCRYWPSTGNNLLSALAPSSSNGKRIDIMTRVWEHIIISSLPIKVIYHPHGSAPASCRGVNRKLLHVGLGKLWNTLENYKKSFAQIKWLTLKKMTIFTISENVSESFKLFSPCSALETWCCVTPISLQPAHLPALGVGAFYGILIQNCIRNCFTGTNGEPMLIEHCSTSGTDGIDDVYPLV